VRSLLVSTNAISGLLVVWMLTIAFLPFPTALVAKAGHQPATKLLYIGTIFLSTLGTGVISWIISRNPAITDGEIMPDAMAGVAGAVLLLLALAITLLIPPTSYFPLLLLTLETPTQRLIDKIMRRA
jgi:uncharacterized membrane protein